MDLYLYINKVTWYKLYSNHSFSSFTINQFVNVSTFQVASSYFDLFLINLTVRYASGIRIISKMNDIADALLISRLTNAVL